MFGVYLFLSLSLSLSLCLPVNEMEIVSAGNEMEMEIDDDYWYCRCAAAVRESNIGKELYNFVLASVKRCTKWKHPVREMAEFRVVISDAHGPDASGIVSRVDRRRRRRQRQQRRRQRQEEERWRRTSGCSIRGLLNTIRTSTTVTTPNRFRRCKDPSSLRPISCTTVASSTESMRPDPGKISIHQLKI